MRISEWTLDYEVGIFQRVDWKHLNAQAWGGVGGGRMLRTYLRSTCFGLDLYIA